MNNYKLETGIPIPAKSPDAPKRGWQSQFPFDVMKVGQTFLVPKAKKAGMLSAMYRTKRLKPEWDFVHRDLRNGTRVWRTK